MGDADAETFSQTGGTGSLMVQPGSRLIQPCVEWRWHWACAELGVGGAVAVPWPAFCRKPTTPFCLPEVVLSSCPVHVKPTFLMVVIHGSSESLQVTSYKLRDDGVGRGFSEQSVQSFSLKLCSRGSWR